MVLQNFNVFGMIEFVEKRIKISATAVNENRPVNFSFKFTTKADKKNESIQFAALLRKDEPVILKTHNRAAISSEVEKSLSKFFSMLENEIASVTDESIDKAVEMSERGMSDDEIEIALGMEIPANTGQILRHNASKKAEVRNFGKDVIVYTEEGYAYVDLQTAEYIAEFLPIYIKKARTGITDKDTNAWMMKAFSRKK